MKIQITLYKKTETNSKSEQKGGYHIPRCCVMILISLSLFSFVLPLIKNDQFVLASSLPSKNYFD